MIKYLILLILLLPVPAFAQPYLICDYDIGTYTYEVEETVGGTVVIKQGIGTEYTLPDGTKVTRLLDLSGYQNGNYKWRARRFGTGGLPSDWSLPFEATKPVGIGNIRIIRGDE